MARPKPDMRAMALEVRARCRKAQGLPWETQPHILDQIIDILDLGAPVAPSKREAS